MDKYITQFIQQPIPEQKEDKEGDAILFAFTLIKLSWLGGDFDLLTNEAYKNELILKGGDKILSKINIEFPDVFNLVNTNPK